MRSIGHIARAIRGTVAVGGAVLLVACSGPTSIAGPSPAALDDRGVTVAQNVGPVLITLTLDPGTPGDNSVVVDVRDPVGAAVLGAVRVDPSIDGAPQGSITLDGVDRRGALNVPRAGRADVGVTVVDGKAAGTAIRFALDLPAIRPAADELTAVDHAMQGLHTLREMQTLTSGGPLLTFHFEYASPDRVRYTTVGSAGLPQETRLIGRERFDRDASGIWTRTDIGFATRVPSTAYARGAMRVRLIGRSMEAADDVVQIAFVQAPDVYYRIWVGAKDHLVRRYVMMTKGHYMTGTYSDYDAPLAISAP